MRRGPEPAAEPTPSELESCDGEAMALAAAHDAQGEARARVRALKRTREGRIRLALEARDYQGIVDCLTRDDVAALVPEALLHEVRHPEQYTFPPDRGADALMLEFEQHLAGLAPPLGPPHW